MRAINFLILFSIFAIFGCDKEKATLKAIEGKWNIQKMYILDQNGFKTLTIPSGAIEFTIDHQTTKTGVYSINLSYLTDTTSNTLNLAGAFTQKNTTDFIFSRPDENDIQAKVQYYTKNDMQFEFPNIDNRGYYFILNR